MKKLQFVWALLMVSCAQTAAAAPVVMPDSWRLLPEDSSAMSYQGFSGNTEIPKDKKEQLESVVDRILNADSESFDKATYVEEALTADPKHPKDWVPWHPEMIVTDLGVSASGLVGAVTMKGTAGVSVYWRRQGTEPAPLLAARADETAIQVSEDASPAELGREIEPAIRAAMATGRIKDEAMLRKNLLASAEEFRGIVQGFGGDQANAWWVSKVRLDVTADASGKIYGIIAIGGEVRFRFEWARIQSAKPKPKFEQALSPRAVAIRSNLSKFVQLVSSDIATVADNLDAKTGFKVHSFRVGIGVTAKGDIGIVKGGASLTGQVYFARNVSKPVVKPLPTLAAEELEPLLLIEDAPVTKHLAFADENGIAHVSDPSGDLERVVYKVDRQRFRNGMDKAVRMAGFFAERASKSKGRRWKIFELKSSFDLSMSGDLGFAAIGGLATVEFNLYNQNF